LNSPASQCIPGAITAPAVGDDLHDTIGVVAADDHINAADLDGNLGVISVMLRCITVDLHLKLTHQTA
jgi:hypothetical protein